MKPHRIYTLTIFIIDFSFILFSMIIFSISIVFNIVLALLFIACCYQKLNFFVESMDSLERMDIKNDTKETSGSKLAYSSNVPTIKPLATSTGIVF